MTNKKKPAAKQPAQGDSRRGLLLGAGGVGGGGLVGPATGYSVASTGAPAAPARLTVTFGSEAFDRSGPDLKPSWLKSLSVAQEDVIGRRLGSGAPLTGEHEHDEPDFEALGPAGFPVIADIAHMRRART